MTWGPAEPPARGQEFQTIGLLRPATPQTVNIKDFNQPAALHDSNAAAQMGNYAQVMTDQNAGQLVAPPQAGNKVENFCLDRDIKGRGWFIKQENSGTKDQCPGNGHSLALAAGELVRVAKPMKGQESYVAQGNGYLLNDVSDPMD